MNLADNPMRVLHQLNFKRVSILKSNNNDKNHNVQ